MHPPALVLLVLLGAPPAGELSAEDREALSVLSVRLDTIADLEERGALTSTAGRAARTRYLTETASTMAFDAEHLQALLDAPTPPDASGFFDFVDLLWVVVGALLLLSLGWLFTIYVLPWLKRLPRWVLEGTIYALCALVIGLPATLLEPSGGQVAIAFAGCLGFGGALFYSFDRHLTGRTSEKAVKLLTLLALFVWGAAALLYQSPWLGTWACVAYMAFMGAVLVPVVGWVELDDRGVGLAMVSAALLVVTFGGLWSLPPAVSDVAMIFRPGALVVGGAVYFAGCLVIASRAYHVRYSDGMVAYIAAQVLALVSGFLMIYLGSVRGWDVVRESGGTFLAVYLIEKVFDLPWSEKSWAWLCLLLALLLYALAYFAERHPRWFLWV